MGYKKKKDKKNKGERLMYTLNITALSVFPVAGLGMLTTYNVMPCLGILVVMMAAMVIVLRSEGEI